MRLLGLFSPEVMARACLLAGILLAAGVLATETDEEAGGDAVSEIQAEAREEVPADDTGMVSGDPGVEPRVVETPEPAIDEDSTDGAPVKITTDDGDAVIGVAPDVEKAENIDLSQPVAPPESKPVDDEAPDAPPVVDAPVPPEKPGAEKEEKDVSVPKPAGKTFEDIKPLFVYLGKSIAPGTTTRLSWSPEQQFEGITSPIPVLVAHGVKPGPRLCLTAAIHGDELTGIEVVRRVLYNIDAKKLHGTVIGVPIVNLQGFLRGSRYLTDRRDLNRYFPGNRQGSSASRIAHSFFKRVIRQCSLLVDLHTGSFYRTNLPQLRADLKDPDVLALTQSFDGIAVLHSEGADGTLRRAAVEVGIPAVTLEAGGPMELDENHVSQGVKSINTLLDKLGMYDTLSFWGAPQPAYYRSMWVRAGRGGILFSEVTLGQRVKKDDVLGKITDPITNVQSVITSPVSGRILGMAVNQVVLPGFAAYHVGLDPKTDTTSIPEASDSMQDIDEEEEAGGDTFD